MRACSVGELMIENVQALAKMPGPNTTVVMEAKHPVFGGAALNVANSFRALGIKGRLVAAVGTCDYSALRKQLHGSGVDIGGLIVVNGGSDQLATLLTREEHRSTYL